MSVRVALIDSGVNANHPHLTETGRVVVGPAIDAEGQLTDGAAGADVLGHGTAAGAAILHLAPTAELVSIQIFKEIPACPFEHVLAALDFAIREGFQLVNLSLGTTRHDWVGALEERIGRAQQSGTAIVAPATFQGLPSFPGSLAGVHGVLMNARLEREAPTRQSHGERDYWYASPYPRELPNLPRESNLVGVSMSAANLTGWLARRIADGEAIPSA